MVNSSVDADPFVVSVNVDRLIDGTIVVVNGSVDVDPFVVSVDVD